MEHTGRYLIVLNRDRSKESVVAMQGFVGAMADSREFKSSSFAAMAQEPSIVLHNIGVAVTTLDPEQALGIQSVGESMQLEPERYVYVLDNADYLRGFRAGVEATYRAVGDAALAATRSAAQSFDESQLTWGLQGIGIANTAATGNGIRVAVLDTGLDLTHPDFKNRGPIVSQSFIDGVTTVQDGHGHGTHCCGTVCGPVAPSTGPRYGVAPLASLYVGKVLSDQGVGADGGILAGIEWAITENCAIISMSLGSDVTPGAPYSQEYEQAAQAGLEQGTLIIAAAGNLSRRPGFINPVGHPANCPSILAIAAIDDQMAIAWFSNGQVGSGKAPYVAGPGVQVYSSWPQPKLYNTISGTSMATPHAAGVAALLAQAQGLSGDALGKALASSAKNIELPPADAGSGLVQAP